MGERKDVVMSAIDGESVSVSRRVGAPPAAVFAVLADPGRHPGIDGSGMLVQAVGQPVISRVGDTFTMRMHNAEMGDYEITNHVVEYVPGQRIAWEPSLSNASRAEDQADIGTRNRHRWSYELTPDGPDGTLVTETYDCTRSPDWLRKAVKGGHRWIAPMRATLEKLEREVAPPPGRSVTKSVTIDRPAGEVHAFLADAANWPRWCVINVLSAEPGSEPGWWTISTPGGAADFRIHASAATGIVDHDFRDETGAVARVPARVTANGRGADFLITITQPDGLPDDDFDQLLASVDTELATLKRVLEDG
jgi:uncharacterized protein YndB with AHSA1/START domain